MAQKRMIHRRILESEKMQALKGHNIARFLYVALLPYTDKLGRLNVNVYGLKGTILEPFEFTTDDIHEALHQLAAVGLVTLYRTPKHKLLAHYTKFTEFNTPHHNEADSDLPGPDDSTSELVAPEGSGNLPVAEARSEDAAGTREDVPEVFPEDYEKEVAPSPSPTPTHTQSLPREEDALDFEDSPAARFTRLMETGKSEQSETARVRSTVRRLAGQDFTSRHERDLNSWTRHATKTIEAMWHQSDPSKWPGETHKQRAWIFADLLDEKRSMPLEERPIPGRTGDELWADIAKELGLDEEASCDPSLN